MSLRAIATWQSLTPGNKSFKDCHVAIAPRNDIYYLERHCKVRSNRCMTGIQATFPRRDCFVPRNDVLCIYCRYR